MSKTEMERIHGATVAGTFGGPRDAGTLAIAGAGLMLVGAGIGVTTGTDIDVALTTGEMSAYLVAAAEHRTALIANLCIWIVGALGLGAAGTAMAGVGNGAALIRDLARFAYWVATALAITAFLAWLAVVIQTPAIPDPTDVAIAEVVGWFAYRTDSVATALIVGFGPALLSWAGRADWVPGWLFGWGLLAALIGVLSFLPYFVPAVPLGFALLIVPVGLGWTLAAGVVLRRQGR